jgi:hypothetical protein
VLRSGDESKEGVDGEAVVLTEVPAAGVPPALAPSSLLPSHVLLLPPLNLVPLLSSFEGVEEVDEWSDGGEFLVCEIGGESLVCGTGVACGRVDMSMLPPIMLPPMMLAMMGVPVHEFKDMLMDESERSTGLLTASTVGPTDTADGAGEGMIDSPEGESSEFGRAGEMVLEHSLLGVRRASILWLKGVDDIGEGVLSALMADRS